MQQLEGKITGELSTLKERVSTMESELHTYRDLDALRHTAEEKKKVTQVMLETSPGHHHQVNDSYTNTCFFFWHRGCRRTRCPWRSAGIHSSSCWKR